jgi:hypothetical protein
LLGDPGDRLDDAGGGRRGQQREVPGVARRVVRGGDGGRVALGEDHVDRLGGGERAQRGLAVAGPGGGESWSTTAASCSRSAAPASKAASNRRSNVSASCARRASAPGSP